MERRDGGDVDEPADGAADAGHGGEHGEQERSGRDGPIGGLGPRQTFWGGVLQTFLIVSAFVAAGLVAGSVALPGEASPPGAPGRLAYHSRAMDRDMDEARALEPRLWLVDGFNTLQVGLLRGRERDGWWTAARRDELLARVRAFDDPEAEVWVVFDGPQPAPPSRGEREPRSPRVAFAPSADEWLLRRIREEAGSGPIAVVTADRRLADRARARGAKVVSPHAFLARCRMPEPSRTCSPSEES